VAKFELTIESEGALSFMELREVIAIIDDQIAEELRYRHRRRYSPYSPFWEFEWLESQPEFSFVEIEAVRAGSIILTISLGAVAVWAIGSVALGMRRSRLGRELARFGENTGNIVSDGLDVINERLEDWSEANKRLRERKTIAKLRQHDRDGQP
jgi:hypothetical protein